MLNQPIVVLGAMKGEISAFLPMSHAKPLENWNRLSFYQGTIAQKNIIVGFTGVGKSMSAMVVQRVIDLYKPSHILFAGLAGALHPEYTIGDIILGKDSIIHDMDASSLGFQRGEIPYTKMRIFPGDIKLLTLAKIYPIQQEVGRLHVGRILTGDVFVSTSNKSKLREAFDGDAVEMEGASVALVATCNQIPHLLIRIISDQSDGRAKIDFEKFLPQASVKLASIVEFVIQKIE